MDDRRFDAITRGLTRQTSRRRAVSGVLAGTMALLTGATGLEAKPGGGKGPSKSKKAVCHFSNGKGGKYKKLTLGGPGADSHVANHANDGYFGDCCPGDTCTAQGQCFTAACSKDATTNTFSCLSTPKEAGAGCTIDTVEGQCDGAGLCCTDPLDPSTCT
jgi:hypothetical protein